MWKDREEGGRALVGALAEWKDERPLVLAIPRGAVPMAALVADGLRGDLDVVLVHKIGHPLQPELAVGAVDEEGHVVATEAAALYGVSRPHLESLARAELERLKRRRELYGRPAADVRGRTAILVDDGIATGATMLAAVKAVRARGAAKVIVATPVASPEAVERLRTEADAVVVIDVPHYFMAVGQFYRDFRQVEDDEVRALLREREPVA